MRVVMHQARPTEDDPREHRTLTVGESYFVIEIGAEDFRVVDDLGEPILFPKATFSMIEQSIPPGWAFCDLGAGEYWLAPIATSRRGFYEDWFGSSGDRARVAETRTILRRAIEGMRPHVDEIDRSLIDRDLARLEAAARRRG